MSFSSILKIIGRIFIGLLLSLRFLEPCLKTGAILADLKDSGYFDEQIHSLY